MENLSGSSELQLPAWLAMQRLAIGNRTFLQDGLRFATGWTDCLYGSNNSALADVPVLPKQKSCWFVAINVGHWHGPAGSTLAIGADRDVLLTLPKQVKLSRSDQSCRQHIIAEGADGLVLQPQVPGPRLSVVQNNLSHIYRRL